VRGVDGSNEHCPANGADLDTGTADWSPDVDWAPGRMLVSVGECHPVVRTINGT